MTETSASTIGPFVRYSMLLDTQAQLQDGMRIASPDEIVGTAQQLDAINRDIAAQRAHPDVLQSALYCGAVLARAVCAGENNSDDAALLQARYRLSQASELLQQDPTKPEFTDNEQFYDIQAALGILATETNAEVPAVHEPKEDAAKLIPVNYEVALQNLRNHLAALAPGEQYKLTPGQLLTLAAPNMEFSRWQRWRLLKRARSELHTTASVFTHNKGRGKSSFYTVGRPAAVPNAQEALPIAA